MIAVLTTCLQALSPYMFCVHTCINTRGKTLLWWSHPVCMFVPALSTAVRLIALKNADTARVQNTFWYRLLPWCKNIFLILYSNGKNIHLYLCNNKYKNISSYQLNCSLRLECIMSHISSNNAYHVSVSLSKGHFSISVPQEGTIFLKMLCYFYH